jgi:precorrin-2 dehydrogenase/sirohydrochlorin ferrochelatase/precorrin-6A/cobalt-precorrin-6A reductase
MQGPFTAEMNIALINQINARYMVTKDSGETGGFPEKYQAARETGAALLVIGREKEEEGISPDALLTLLENTFGIALQTQSETGQGQWFPLFTNISGKTIVVIGAGKIAGRRIETLLKFDCRIRVIAREADPEVAAYAEAAKLELRVKPYDEGDLEGAAYVLAATNDKQINHEIYEKCRENSIPVNVADDKEKSDFYFPGIIRKHGITVGVTAEGRDHALAKKTTRMIADCLDRNRQ